jgi:general secretion pathway protein I
MILRSPTRRAVSRGRRGLSLIEVLLALAILVLAVAAISSLVDIGTDRGNDARMYTRGVRLAQAKMAEVESGLIPVTGGETDGQFTDDDAAWSYKIFIQPAGPPNLYTVTVNVLRDASGQQFVVSVAQMMFDPSLMGSAAQAERPATTDPSTSGTTGTGTGTGTGGTSP